MTEMIELTEEQLKAIESNQKIIKKLYRYKYPADYRKTKNETYYYKNRERILENIRIKKMAEREANPKVVKYLEAKIVEVEAKPKKDVKKREKRSDLDGVQKKTFTEEEIKEMKAMRQRKPRSDKGQKRGNYNPERKERKDKGQSRKVKKALTESKNVESP